MEMQVAVKVKLNLANAEIASSFTNMMEQYRLACNYVSEYIFNHDFDMKQSRLNKELYTPEIKPNNSAILKFKIS